MFDEWHKAYNRPKGVDEISVRRAAFLAGMEAQKQRDVKFATLEAECADLSTEYGRGKYSAAENIEYFISAAIEKGE